MVPTQSIVEGTDFEIFLSQHPDREGWCWKGIGRYIDYSMPLANGGYMTKDDAIANAREILAATP